MKVLITGATGLIGQALSSYLLGKGHTVHYLTTQPSKRTDSTRYHGFLWNPIKEEIDVSCLEGVEVIVHLAGENIGRSWNANGKRKILDSRINSSKLLFTTLQTNPHCVKTIVCASAIGIYKNSEAWQDEETNEVATDFLGEVVVKWEAENLKFETIGVAVCLIRIGMVLSRTDGALPALITPVKWNVGSPLGRGNQYCSWVHIDDVTRLFAYAVQNQLKGVYNAVAEKPVTNKTLVKVIAAKLNKFLWLPAVPTFLLRIVLGEKHILVTSGQRIANTKIREAGFVFKYSELDKALDGLLKSV